MGDIKCYDGAKRGRIMNLKEILIDYIMRDLNSLRCEILNSINISGENSEIKAVLSLLSLEDIFKIWACDFKKREVISIFLSLGYKREEEQEIFFKSLINYLHFNSGEPIGAVLSEILRDYFF